MTEILVVGAGPVGLSCAIDLLRRGVSCRVIEKSPVAAVGTRARGISCRTQEIFESLGVLASVREFAEPNLPARFYNRDSHLLREKPASKPAPPAPEVPWPNALMVSQQNTDAALRRRLFELGGRVEMNCALIGIRQETGLVAATVIGSEKREVIPAQYLIGCDGGGSTVRKLSGLQFTGETWEDAASYLIGNLSVSGLERGFWHIWTDPEWGYLTLQPVIHGNSWLFVATLQGHELAEWREPTAQSMSRLFKQRLPFSKVFFEDLTWHSVYRRQLRIAERYRSGRVFLAGDSAHIGVEHGMNIGIQEACNLSWKLAQVLRGAPAELLDTYEEERQPVARRILGVTLNRDRNRSGVSAAAQSITSAVSGEESANDPTQLSVAYRNSSLSCDLDCTTLIRVGGRAPDSPGLGTLAGKQIRLFEVMDSRRFTLLCFTEGPPPAFPELDEFLTIYRIVKSGITIARDGHTLGDFEGHAHRAYGVDAEALFLIRPDGYIAATGRPDRLSAMLGHLRLAIPSRVIQRAY